MPPMVAFGSSMHQPASRELFKISWSNLSTKKFLNSSLMLSLHFLISSFCYSKSILPAGLKNFHAYHLPILSGSSDEVVICTAILLSLNLKGSSLWMSSESVYDFSVCYDLSTNCVVKLTVLIITSTTVASDSKPPTLVLNIPSPR